MLKPLFRRPPVIIVGFEVLRQTVEPLYNIRFFQTVAEATDWANVDEKVCIYERFISVYSQSNHVI